MNWKKLGKIFDPAGYRLPNECKAFSQAPQALVFDDLIRIYFSTRQADQNGAYLSHVAYVDFDRNLTTILGISTKTVLPLGGLGCFDEHGIFPLSVKRFGDRICGYTTGLNRKESVGIDSAIGYVESDDGGKTFHRTGPGPIMATALHEPFLVADAFVSLFDDCYHMWYIHGIKWTRSEADAPPDRVYQIAHATSDDGFSWHREGRKIIATVLGGDECQAMPTVAFYGGKYHMFFCYRSSSDFRKNKARGYRLGYAYSTDLVSWTRDDSSSGIDVSEADWDSDMMCYPNLFVCEGKLYLLYNGNEFGRHGFGAAVLEGIE